MRANHIYLEPSLAGADASVMLAVPATVELSEISGSETFVHARHNGSTLVAQREGVHGFALGQPVVLYLDPRRLYVFDGGGTLAAAPAAHRGGGLMAASNSRASPTATMRTRRRPTDYALQPLDMTWEDGGAYALLGPSGCGKTTLLNIISGLRSPEPGARAVRRPRRDAICRRSSATSPRCSSSRSSTTR